MTTPGRRRRRVTLQSAARRLRAKTLLLDEGLGLAAVRMPESDARFVDLMARKVMPGGASREVTAAQLRRLTDLGRKYKR
jgi:hypothetical protein